MNPLNKILLGIGGAITLIIAIVIIWLCFANAHLRVQLAEAQANDTACQITNDDFRRKAEQQNQAIALLKTAGTAEARRAEEAVKAAEKKAAAFQADADRLKRQKSSGNDCKAAADLVDRYRARLK